MSDVDRNADRSVDDDGIVNGGISIASVGAYVPRYVLTSEAYAEAWGRGGPPGIERTAVPDADEDTLTMATEAVVRALDAADVDAADVTYLALGTTTPPVEEEDLLPRLASLVGVPPTAMTRQFGGSTRAGATALTASVDADFEGYGLVVASDCPQGTPESDTERAAGAGAAALLLAPDGPCRVTARGEFTSPYPGTRFRRRGTERTERLDVTTYEREAYRTVVEGAVDALELDGSDTEAVSLTAPDGKRPYRVASSIGASTEQIAAGTVVSETGDTGTAGPFLGLASALREDAREVLLVGYGSGAGATAFRLEAGGRVPVNAVLEGDVELSYADSLRWRGVVTGGDPEGGGAYVSAPSWRRTIPQRHRLVAGRCSACGALSFPPEGACPDCGSRAGYEDVSLPGTGTVEAVTTIGQGGAPPEFVEQQQRSGAFAVAIVAFDAPGDSETKGGTESERGVSAPAQMVSNPTSDLAIGDRVETVHRRIYEQEGVIRYGFKIVPTAARR